MEGAPACRGNSHRAEMTHEFMSHARWKGECMTRQAFAQELRARQVRAGYLPAQTLAAVSDERLVRGYCGDVPPPLLASVLAAARDADEVFRILEALQARP